MGGVRCGAIPTRSQLEVGAGNSGLVGIMDHNGSVAKERADSLQS